MHERGRLLLNRGGDARMAMPEVAYGNSGGEVEIFAPVGIPEARAGASHEKNLRCVGGHHILPVPFDGRLIQIFHDRSTPMFGKTHR